MLAGRGIRRRARQICIHDFRYQYFASALNREYFNVLPFFEILQKFV